MKKLNIKVLFFLALISFFVGINNVKANVPDESWCYYYSPLAFIDDSSRATNVVLKVPYYLWDSKTGKVFDSRSSTVTMKAFCLNYDANSNYYLGFSSINSINEPAVEGSVTPQNVFFFDTKTFSIDSSAANGSKFVELLKVKKNKYKIIPSNKTAYASFLKKQYQPLSTDAKRYNLYNFISLEFTSSKTMSDSYLTTVSGDYIGDIKDRNESFKKFLDQDLRDGTIGVIFATDTEKYPTTQLDNFKEMMATAEKEDGSKYTDEEKQNMLDGLGVAIDVGEYDYKAVTEVYYNTTKDLWYEYMKDDLKNPKKAESTRKTYFRYWFDLVGRRVFEEKDSSKFLEYWDYICETKTYDLCEGKTSCDQKTICENVKNVINGKETYKSSSKNISNLQSNFCLAACKSCLKDTESYNATSCEACKTSSTSTGSYKKCTSCNSTAKSNCTNVGSQYKDSCETSELKKCLGEDVYNEIKNNYDNALRQYQSTKQNAANNAASSAITLYSVNTVEMPVIGLKNMEYEPQCKDVEFLTDMWSLLSLLGPFLMIIFGAFDYFAAVVSSDMDRLKKAKSKFPKRLIAFLLLLIVPMLIKILLRTFGTRNSGNLTYLYCILSGDKNGEYQKKSDSDNGSNSKSSSGSSVKTTTGTSNPTNANARGGNEENDEDNDNNNNDEENPVDAAVKKTKEVIEKADQDKAKQEENKTDNSENSNNNNNDSNGKNTVKPNNM